MSVVTGSKCGTCQEYPVCGPSRQMVSQGCYQEKFHCTANQISFSFLWIKSLELVCLVLLNSFLELHGFKLIEAAACRFLTEWAHITRGPWALTLCLGTNFAMGQSSKSCTYTLFLTQNVEIEHYFRSMGSSL